MNQIVANLRKGMDELTRAYAAGYCDAFEGKYQPYKHPAPMHLQRAYESGHWDGVQRKSELATQKSA